MQAVSVRVSGRVQGVGFRAWTVETARSLGLNGWVRNRRDGTVEALVAGDTEAVEAMLLRLNQGSPGSRVDGVERQPAEPPQMSGFAQRPTG